ncbi:hypothetical protein VOLCADRAFT_93328 [Volvox carteri f. nagariensis]|uniref:Uncharacterized protein n=1 Tax=Volvox carteri f. nagariensis TaxID=3068 RepID=D8U1U8_VOLCA|nr:uncharacterized protein VOLCADRAFT_93328 [Volvox carteri f. nagariensis]EFJ46176.1 hypothetical protein VOLCADRAFT_93328 [Volvox carteri f. nagariensis]|eukprot:XP_002952623.1 hypothetical protein VOLCADRAFT_93328 [Volvox carteri f. nagariensis]
MNDTHETLLPSCFDHVLLQSAFGSDPRVRFALRTDEAAAAVQKKGKLFELVPATTKNHSSAREQGPPERHPDTRAVVVHATSITSGRNASSSQDGSRSSTAATVASTITLRFHFHTPAANCTTRCRTGGCGCGGGRSSICTGGGRGCGCGCGCADLGNVSYNDPPGCAPQQLTPVARSLAAAAHLAVGFGVLKMRFYLGKHLFRNVGFRMGRSDLSISDLEGASSGRGAYQSVFSNYVPASTVPRVTSWLTDVLGFSLTDTKTTATLHVINQELNVHYSIALTMEGGMDTAATLRKVKAGGSRFHSVALLAGPEQLDLRLKFVARSAMREQQGLSYDVDAHSTARRVAAAVRTEGFDGFIRSKRGLPRNRHLEYGRRKTKFVYEGFMPPSEGEGGCGQRLRVSVTQVQDDKGMHYEISGRLPDVDAKLNQLLTQQRPPSATSPPQSPPPPATSVDDSGCFVPEWRRRGGSSGDGRPGPGSTSVSRLVGHQGLHSHTSSGGGSAYRRTNTPETGGYSRTDIHTDTGVGWAADVLMSLSTFTTQLNHYLAPAAGASKLRAG